MRTDHATKPVPSADPEQFLKNLGTIQLREITEQDRTTAIRTAEAQLSGTLPPIAALAILYEAWTRWLTVALTRSERPDLLDLIDAVHREPAHIAIGRFTGSHLSFDAFVRDACRPYGRKFLPRRPAPYANPRHPTP